MSWGSSATLEDCHTPSASRPKAPEFCHCWWQCSICGQLWWLYCAWTLSS